MPWTTHMMVGNLKDNFSCKESRILSSIRPSASQRWLSEEGKCNDISYATVVVVFKITYFHKLIHQPFDEKNCLSSHEQLSFHMTNVTCNSGHKSGSKIQFSFPHWLPFIFSVLRFHGVHQKGRDFGTLCSNNCLWDLKRGHDACRLVTADRVPTVGFSFRCSCSLNLNQAAESVCA